MTSERKQLQIKTAAFVFEAEEPMAGCLLGKLIGGVAGGAAGRLVGGLVGGLVDGLVGGLEDRSMIWQSPLQPHPWLYIILGNGHFSFQKQKIFLSDTTAV